MELELTKFIKENPDWEQKLTEAPYYITIKRKDNFILFSYNQIDSDFYNPIVRECRGIILDSTYNPVCVPFYKFGNYGEGYVDTLDWASARVQEKVDGSLIKVWNYNSEWHVSTNGMIDAKDAELYTDICEYKTFYDLFIEAAKNSNLDIAKLDPNYTWMFELISPYNRVVVPYTVTELRHIGTRNILNLEECEIDIGVNKPKLYPLRTLDECIAVASTLPFSEEGYVVVDKFWHRNKIKSPAYVAAHYMVNNRAVSKTRIVEMLRNNNHEEFLNYFPEYTDAFDNIRNKINAFIEEMNSHINSFKNKLFDSRKEFAKMAISTKCPALLFSWLDQDYAKIWLWEQTNNKILQWIGEKDE